MYNGSIKEPYTNPGAPVHIITGSAVRDLFYFVFNFTASAFVSYILSVFGLPLSVPLFLTLSVSLSVSIAVRLYVLMIVTNSCSPDMSDKIVAGHFFRLVLRALICQ